MHALTTLIDVSSDKLISEWISFSDRLGQNPLHFICAYNEPKVVARLIQLGCNQHSKSGLGATPLDIAIQHNRTAVIEELLKSPSPNFQVELAKKHRGARILTTACKKSNYPLIRRVIELSGPQEIPIQKKFKFRFPGILFLQRFGCLAPCKNLSIETASDWPC